jgi:ComF family protein
MPLLHERLRLATRRLRADLRAAFLELLDAVYPARCPVCGAPPDGAPDAGAACGFHALTGPGTGPRCGRCAAPISEHLPDGATCADCRADPPAFVRARTLGEYRSGEGLRDWVLALKHRGRADLAVELGEALAARLAGERREGAVLVPVPLHPWRRLERGYDQALLLAREAARAAGLPLAPALRRVRWGGPQGAPGAVSRRANVSGAFRPRPRGARQIAGARVWLVDDVLTSGATASECARLLKRLGAREVGVLAVARASPRGGGRGPG